jgi:hypothetical protein
MIVDSGLTSSSYQTLSDSVRTSDVLAFGIGSGKRPVLVSSAFVTQLVVLYKQFLNMKATRSSLHQIYIAAMQRLQSRRAQAIKAGLKPSVEEDATAFIAFVTAGPPSLCVLWGIFDSIFESSLRSQCEAIQQRMCPRSYRSCIT